MLSQCPCPHNFPIAIGVIYNKKGQIQKYSGILYLLGDYFLSGPLVSDFRINIYKNEPLLKIEGTP
jgi:hypothetical protein